MFVVKVSGGLYDGQNIMTDGWIPFLTSPSELTRLFGLTTAKFDDLADAQDFVVSRYDMVQSGDYGVGATLVIEEMDGDIKYERY